MERIKVKITLVTSSRRKEFFKEFKDIEFFNKYKNLQLNNNCNYLKYSFIKNNKFTESKTEFGNLEKENIKEKNIEFKNTPQKNSRENQLALIGNKLINLNITNAKQKSLVKFMEINPFTEKEKNIIKSMFLFSKLSVDQYLFIEDIKKKSKRRVKLLNQ